jgi:hypothetical protein
MTPEALFELFWDWQRTQTQSSVTAPRSPRQQMDVRFCEEQEPPAERHTCARMNPESEVCAVSRPRPIHLRLPLTTDLHGCRQYGSFGLGPDSQKVPSSRLLGSWTVAAKTKAGRQIELFEFETSYERAVCL